ncbi:hypothetical protein EVAR_12591_1 [Eumeta japonica]|uniref:Uncharacterized protein n=1 Tax=Eumeta variegata TaxID=151549 RepID=A0A4C1UG78_EUMVA|nr:hypothetical protein EVAR_12591_1 [Eumeta japonica]
MRSTKGQAVTAAHGHLRSQKSHHHQKSYRPLVFLSITRINNGEGNGLMERSEIINRSKMVDGGESPELSLTGQNLGRHDISAPAPPAAALHTGAGVEAALVHILEAKTDFFYILERKQIHSELFY